MTAARRRPVPTYQGLVTEEAFSQSYANLFPGAVRVARRWCGREAEDVVQDVALALLRRRDTLTAQYEHLLLFAVSRKARTRCAAQRREHLA